MFIPANLIKTPNFDNSTPNTYSYITATDTLDQVAAPFYFAGSDIRPSDVISVRSIDGEMTFTANGLTAMPSAVEVGRVVDSKPSAEVSNLDDAIALALSGGVPVDGRLNTLEYHAGTGIGGNSYQLIDAGSSGERPTADGGSVIHLTGGSGGLYLKGLFLDGIISVDRFGAKPGYDAFDNAPAFANAAKYAVTLSTQIVYTSDINAKVDVILSAGKTYYLTNSTVALDVEAVRVNFCCLAGSANVAGAKLSTPSVRNAVGFTFNRLYRTSFTGINFGGFVKVMMWDTNNVDAATVTYDRCEFHDCGDSGVPAIDTVSFALSRSTVLTFINCIVRNTKMLLDCYCDTLNFTNGYYQSWDTNGAFIKADSKVTINNGIWTPYATGDNARWFDLYDNSVSGSRGLNSYGGRFGPEGGGIPVVYNFMNGQNTAGNHATNFICFYGGSAEASPATALHNSLVVLTESSGQSIAPSIIGFYGASVKAKAGLVRTQSGGPVSKVRGRFAIDVSPASQSHLSDYNTAPPVPLVESQLRIFLVSEELYKEPVSQTISGDTTLDAGLAGMNGIFHLAGTGTVVGISNAFDGQLITLMLNSGGITIQDTSNGSRLWLAGSANFTDSQFSSITLRWHRAGNKWIEQSRSAR